MSRPTKAAIRAMYKRVDSQTARLERTRRQCDAAARRFNVAQANLEAARRRSLSCKAAVVDVESQIRRLHTIIAEAEAERGMKPGAGGPKSHNPPAWVRDKKVWARAKREASKGKPRDLYAVTTTIYRGMGGRVR